MAEWFKADDFFHQPYTYIKNLLEINMPGQYSIKTCIQCGSVGRRNGKKYCSLDCKNKFEYNTRINSWMEGTHDGLRGGIQTSTWIKKWLRETYGNKCSMCGWNTVNPHTNIVPLEIEHKDGNFKNNRPENLTLLCPNCHSLTSTYKGRNKGNGRFLQMKDKFDSSRRKIK